MMLPRLAGVTLLSLVVGGATAAPITGAFQIPKLLYYGGRVVEHAKVRAVYWGTVDPSFKTRLETFYASLVAGEHFDFLTEYDTNIAAVSGAPGTNQVIGRGITGPSILIGNPVNKSTTISANDVE